MAYYNTENIVALATPPGIGALAIIRISGSDLRSTYKSFSHKNPTDRMAVYSKIFHPKSNKILDEAIITYFKSPNSFTGEDVIEISCHGGAVVPRSIILATIDSCKARNANPGEFSFRAFLNGKMDLLQAEAVSSLIASKSQFSADVSLKHLQGHVSNILSKIRGRAIDLLAVIENELNFSEEELNLTSYDYIRSGLVNIQLKLNSILKNSVFGKDAMHGIRVVIIGKPNSGKSSLFNSILGHDRAIVSNIPGTTRDTIESYFDLKGLPICLIDTAGVWESDEFLEKLGIEKTIEALKQASLCILIDDVNPTQLLKSNLSSHLGDHFIFVKSKYDLNKLKIDTSENIFYVSSKKSLGIDKLLTYISTYLAKNVNSPKMLDRVLVTHRQRHLLASSLSIIDDVIKQIDGGFETDIIASGLRGFVISLMDVVGEVHNEEVLTHIFSNFCVGK